MPNYRSANLEIRMNALETSEVSIFVLKIYQLDFDSQHLMDLNCLHWKNNSHVRVLHDIGGHMYGAEIDANDENARVIDSLQFTDNHFNIYLLVRIINNWI